MLATLVLAAITSYFAWTTRALVRESHAALQATARAALDERLARIGEILLRDPQLFHSLDDPQATGEERDARFHLANMLMAVLHEAHRQYAIDRSMPEEEWRAWVAITDFLIGPRYLVGYWRRVGHTFGPPFRQVIEERLGQTGGC